MKTRTAVLSAVLVSMVIAGCTSPDASCPAVEAQFASTVAHGGTITVQLENVFSACSDTGGATSAAPGEVELDLVAVDTAEKVLATGVADVGSDGTAVVELAVPADATGTASIEYDGASLGIVSITG